MSTIVETETLEDVLEEVGISNEKQIILYNDDINTFAHVMKCLMKYCKHNSLQAEQCSLIVHTTGKAQVKKGGYDTIKPICEALTENGLDAKIE